MMAAGWVVMAAVLAGARRPVGGAWVTGWTETPGHDPILLGRGVRLQAENWSAPPPDREPQHGIEERRPERRRCDRLVHHGLEGGSIKIIEHEAVTVMIDKRSKIG